ncbi:DNA replication licensing factor mcm8 [Balamuthia mandrillaris]
MGSVRREGFTGWDLYFPDEPFSVEDHAERTAFIQVFIDYFHGCAELLQKSTVRRTLHITLNFLELKKSLPAAEQEKFAIHLREEPSPTLACIGVALYEVVFGRVPQSEPRKKINVRIVRYEKSTLIKNIKANSIDKFVSVQGTVVRVGNVKPLVVQLDFMCTRCDAVITVPLSDGKYDPPTKCSTGNCRSKGFEPIRPTAITVDWQKIRIQEYMHSGDLDAGRVPRTIECELSEDLVDSCVPGDVVTLCGVVKVVSTEVERGRSNKNKQKSMYYLYIDTVGIENCKQADKLEMVEFSKRDYLFITQLKKEEKKIFPLIVQSLCPTIYGHELVKAGLTLALFGGSRRDLQRHELAVRPDSHLLIVGDPGLGKSQMLQAVTNVAPRGVYVCGSYSSSSGLTVTLFKEKGSGDYALEAGALVLGDQGCCCIDEFDKMGKEHQALLEAMEQQSISIAKAGIVCSLPARTAVIAAANPVGGHYNPAKTIAENIKLTDVLLSRFDLVFVLLDKPDAERDKLISKHVMAMHSSPSKKMKLKRKRSEASLGEGDDLDPEDFDDEGNLPLATRLKQPMTDLIPPPLLRKYIGYARKYCSPKLSPGARTVLQDFYLSLRAKHKGTEGAPITTRQLESLIRLSEARAKLELRDEVTEQDAKDVVELMKGSLFDLLEDGLATIDLRGVGGGGSKTKALKAFVELLRKVSEEEYNSRFTSQQLWALAQKHGLKVDDFDAFLERLNFEGYLLKRGPRTFELQISKYAG